jgi:selenocysteine lyase/cysteine desulfurase
MFSVTNGTLRERIVSGYEAIRNYEGVLTKRFLEKANKIEGLKVYGIKDLDSTFKGK